MKNTSQSPLISCLLIVCLFIANFSHAQETDPANAFATVQSDRTSVKNVSPDRRDTAAKSTASEYRFDLNAGQHRAAFTGLTDYIAEHLVYPESARENAVEGIVEVLVTISPDGKITEAAIVRSLDEACDQAALDLVTNMPLWKPASNYGIPTKDKARLQLQFRLR